MTKLFRFFRLSVALITVEALLLATSQESVVHPPAPVNQPKSSIASGPAPEEMMPMPVVAPLFVQSETTDSEITIVSDFSKTLNLDVILSSPSGEELARTKVSMSPRSQKKLRVADLLVKAPSDAAYGSVLLMPERPAPFAAQLSIVDRSGSSPTDLEEEFVMLTGTKPANYRAVTRNISAAPVISIRSVSPNRQTVSVTCLTDAGPAGSSALPIGPNQMLTVRACNGSAAKLVGPNEGLFEKGSDVNWSPNRAVGIAVSSAAPAEELAVFGVGLHENSKQSMSAIPFSDVNTLRSSNAVYTGVPVGPGTVFGSQSFSLRAAFANFGGASRTAAISLSSGSDASGTQKAIATVNIPPNSTSTTDLPVSPDGAPANSLVVTVDADPGEVMSEVQAVSGASPSPSAIALSWKDQEQFENGGRHPWSVDPSTSSTLLLFNPDPTLKNDSIRIAIYAGQSVWTKKLSLPPLATLAISLNDIVYKQQPDDKGRKLPTDAAAGILTWSALTKPRIFGKLLQTDAMAGIRRVRTYACGSITSVCSVSLQNAQPNPFLIGQQTSVYVNEIQACTGDSPCSCNDGCGSAFGNGSMFWSSENPGTASLVSSPTDLGVGTYVGNSAGQTWADASATDNNGCGGSGGTSITVPPYSQSDINNAAGALLGYDSIDANGNVYNAQLDPDAYNYLQANGYLAGAGTVVITTLSVPGLGEIVIVIVVTVITVSAIIALKNWIAARGQYDPIVVRDLANAGPKAGSRDSNGNCDPNSQPTPNYKWQAVNKTGANAGQVHWHYSQWNLDPVNCIWYLQPHLDNGTVDPGPSYQLLPGLYQAP